MPVKLITHQNAYFSTQTDSPKQNRFTWDDIYFIISILIFAFGTICVSLLIFNDKTLGYVLKYFLSLPQVQKHFDELDFENVYGCLLCGKWSFRNVKIKKHTDARDFEFHIDKLNMYVPWQRILLKRFTKGKDCEIYIPLVHIDGLNGVYTEKETTEKKEPQNVVIFDLAVHNANIKYKNTKMTDPVDIKVDIWRLWDEFHLRNAASDIVFTSIIKGYIQDHPVHVLKMDDKIHWQLTEFPVNVIKQFFNKPPIDWLTEGTMDVVVGLHML